MFYSGYMGGEKIERLPTSREAPRVHHYQRGQGMLPKKACERNAYQTWFTADPNIPTRQQPPHLPNRIFITMSATNTAEFIGTGRRKTRRPGQNQGRNRQLRDQWSRPSRILQNRAAKKNRRLPFGHRREDEQRGRFGQCFGRRRCRSSRSHQARSLPGLGKNGS